MILSAIPIVLRLVEYPLHYIYNFLYDSHFEGRSKGLTMRRLCLSANNRPETDAELIARMVFCHILQPVAYCLALRYYAANREMSNLQFSLTVALMVFREVAYLVTILLCAVWHPAVFGVDIVASVRDHLGEPVTTETARGGSAVVMPSRNSVVGSEWKVGKRFWAWYVFAPESLMMHALFVARAQSEREKMMEQTRAKLLRAKQASDGAQRQISRGQAEESLWEYMEGVDGLLYRGACNDNDRSDPSGDEASIEADIEEVNKQMDANIDMALGNVADAEQLRQQAADQIKPLAKKFNEGSQMLLRCEQACGPWMMFVNVLCCCALLSFVVFGTLKGHAYALIFCYAQIAPVGILLGLSAVTQGQLCRCRGVQESALEEDIESDAVQKGGYKVTVAVRTTSYSDAVLELLDERFTAEFLTDQSLVSYGQCVDDGQWPLWSDVRGYNDGQYDDKNQGWFIRQIIQQLADAASVGGNGQTCVQIPVGVMAKIPRKKGIPERDHEAEALKVRVMIVNAVALWLARPGPAASELYGWMKWDDSALRKVVLLEGDPCEWPCLKQRSSGFDSVPHDEEAASQPAVPRPVSKRSQECLGQRSDRADLLRDAFRQQKWDLSEQRQQADDKAREERIRARAEERKRAEIDQEREQDISQHLTRLNLAESRYKPLYLQYLSEAMTDQGCSTADELEELGPEMQGKDVEEVVFSVLAHDCTKGSWLSEDGGRSRPDAEMQLFATVELESSDPPDLSALPRQRGRIRFKEHPRQRRLTVEPNDKGPTIRWEKPKSKLPGAKYFVKPQNGFIHRIKDCFPEHDETNTEPEPVLPGELRTKLIDHCNWRTSFVVWVGPNEPNDEGSRPDKALIIVAGSESAKNKWIQEIMQLLHPEEAWGSMEDSITKCLKALDDKVSAALSLIGHQSSIQAAVHAALRVEAAL